MIFICLSQPPGFALFILLQEIIWAPFPFLIYHMLYMLFYKYFIILFTNLWRQLLFLNFAFIGATFEQ